MLDKMLYDMAIKTKAVGVRFPLELIERIERYQNEQSVNFTEALVKLVELGLGGDKDEAIKKSDSELDERITACVEQLLNIKLDERITKIINDRLDERMAGNVEQTLDIELDKSTGENIPSDDSSNSESIADAIEQASGEIEILSWGDFYKMLGLSTTGNPSKAKGDIAIATAKEQERGTWVMNSSTRKFTKLTEDK